MPGRMRAGKIHAAIASFPSSGCLSDKLGVSWKVKLAVPHLRIYSTLEALEVRSAHQISTNHTKQLKLSLIEFLAIQVLF